MARGARGFQLDRYQSSSGWSLPPVMPRPGLSGRHQLVLGGVRTLRKAEDGPQRRRFSRCAGAGRQRGRGTRLPPASAAAHRRVRPLCLEDAQHRRPAAGGHASLRARASEQVLQGDGVPAGRAAVHRAGGGRLEARHRGTGAHRCRSGEPDRLRIPDRRARDFQPSRRGDPLPHARHPRGARGQAGDQRAHTGRRQALRHSGG